jgi:serine/threonine protein kinase
MGQGWEAMHLLTNRLVAVKVLHASLNAQPQMRRRLLREARAATSFGHPNVVEVFDVFELPDATPVMIMELLQGETLRQRVDRAGQPTLEEIATWMVQVVSAIGTAHAHDVIHRDVKPDNVFLCGDTGLVKVVDFGIAKLMHPDPQDGTSATATGAFVGTIGYMAPEQAFGEKDIDHRADVWSVGAILYELLSGVRPVQGSSLGQIIGRFLTEPVVALRTRVDSVPESLAQLVDRMLAHERGARVSDLREVLTELDTPSTSLRASDRPRPRARSRRRARDRGSRTCRSPMHARSSARWRRLGASDAVGDEEAGRGGGRGLRQSPDDFPPRRTARALRGRV